MIYNLKTVFDFTTALYIVRFQTTRFAKPLKKKVLILCKNLFSAKNIIFQEQNYLEHVNNQIIFLRMYFMLIILKLIAR